jgi:hypothetical protein
MYNPNGASNGAAALHQAAEVAQSATGLVARLLSASGMERRS